MQVSSFYPALVQLILCAVYCTNSARAIPLSWQGGGADTNWGLAQNWSPDEVPSEQDSVFLGNLVAEATQLDQDYLIRTLAVSNGASVNTNNHRLEVSGSILLSGLGSRVLTPTGSPASGPVTLSAGSVTMFNNAKIEMLGGEAVLGVLSLGATAAIRGYGTISSTMFANEGEIVAISDVESLKLDAGSNLINLDGSGENGTLRAIDGSMSVLSGLSDDFDGDIFIDAGRQIDFFVSSNLGSGGVVSLQGALNNPARIGAADGTSATFGVAGTLTVDRAGVLTNPQLLTDSQTTLTNNALLEVLGTDMRIDVGASVVGSGQLVHQGGLLTLADGVQLEVPLFASGTSALAQLRIGDTLGTAEVSSYTGSAQSRLEIEIGGTGAGEFDQLITTLAATLDGDLDVSLVGGFEPQLGDSFQILSSMGSLTGTFDVTPEDLPTLSGNLAWDIVYDEDQSLVSLDVVQGTFSADFDVDGDVDLDDLKDPVNGWQARYGDDLNGGDILNWQRQLGSNSLPLAASSIPEPSTLVLLSLAGIVLLPRTRRI